MWLYRSRNAAQLSDRLSLGRRGYGSVQAFLTSSSRCLNALSGEAALLLCLVRIDDEETGLIVPSKLSAMREVRLLLEVNGDPALIDSSY
jgi:hypothetical protein